MPAPGIPNTKELTCTNGIGSAGDVFNVNTSAGQVEIPNNKNIKGYSDAYTTLTWQIANGAFNPSVSATSPALATSGTVTTNVGVARVTPGSAVTAVVLGSGTINGQECWVVNESTTVSNTIAFAASASSFVADGVVDVIPGLSAKKFIWDNSLSAWMSTGQLINGSMVPIVSSAAAAL